MAHLASKAAAAALTVASLVATTPADAAPQPQWEVATTQSISGQNMILNSVTVPAANDVWAVGYRWGYVGGALEFRTLIMNGAGGGFRMIPSRDREGAPATNMLDDAHGVSSTDLWAVGYSRDPGKPSRTLVEHWDGSSWEFSPSLDPGARGNGLEGVVALAADDVWAVGSRQDTPYQVPMAQHWNGSSWSVVSVPNPSFCNVYGHSHLTDVAATSNGIVWAAGSCQSSSRGGDQGFVVRWNGTRWTLPAPLNQAVPTGVDLVSVSTYGLRVWVGGTHRDNGAFAMRNVGGWQPAPVQAPNGTFAAVVARPGGAAWGVGTALSPQPPFAGPGAIRMSARAVTTTPVPVDFGSLRGAAWDPAGRIWAVGRALPGRNDVPLLVSRSDP